MGACFERRHIVDAVSPQLLKQIGRVTMLKQIKRACLMAGKFCGVFGLASRSSRRKSRLLVIGYHGVSLADEHHWNPALFLSPENFRARMGTLKSWGCHVLDLDEALDLLYRGSLPERAVVLTFDDGTY